MSIKHFIITAVTIPMIMPSVCGQTSAETRLCWYEPADAKQNQEITVYFNAAQGSKGLLNYTGDVYAHAGILTDQSSSSGDWKHAPQWCDNDPKYMLRRSASDANIYSWTITPSEFFNLGPDEKISDLAFVMRSSDGSKTGKDVGDSDIIVPFLGNQGGGSNRSLGNMVSHSTDGHTLTVQAEHGKLMLTCYNDYVFKVFTLPTGDTSAERNSISVSAKPEGQFDVTDNDDAVIVATAGTKVTISKTGCTVSFADIDGSVRLIEKDGLNNSSVPRQISFAAMNDLGFYGGGYNGKGINLNGSTLTMNNNQTGGWDCTWSAPHNICIPFVVSTSGYGLLIDDHYRGARLRPSSSGTTYQSGSLNPIAYYYIGGDGSMASVLENYTFLTGRQELPPYWALGYMTSRYGYRSRSEAESVVSSIKQAGLPLDAIVFDLYWQGRDTSGMGNLKWSGDWQNPSQMMKQFDEQGVKTILITEPFFTSNSSNYEPLARLGYMADENVNDMDWLNSDKVGLIDASNPDAMDWMWQYYKARTEEGVGGWWLDLGEPESHDYDSRHAGGSVDQVHNEFGNLWVERVYRGLKEEFPEMRPFIMPRAGTAGMQRFSTFPWTGDIRRSYEGLRAQVPALLSSSMSGVAYMGSDVGGFTSSGTNAELYLRWVEFAVFSPMMRTHSPDRPEPYLPDYANVLNDVRRYIHMRYSYLPYTYTLAYENATKGTPLARPVNFYSSGNRSLSNCADEYLWGRDILVAPVLESAQARRITFPDGQWVDLNDLTHVYEGNTTINYDAPLNKLPHFGRKGSIITRYSQSTYSTTGDIDASELTMTYLTDDTPDAVVTAKIFDDDKQSTSSIDDQNYLLTTVTASASDDGHRIAFHNDGNGYAGMPSERTVTIVIPRFTQLVDHISSSLYDEPFAKQKSLTDFNAAQGPAYYLADDKTLHLRSAIPTSMPSEILIAQSASSIASINDDDTALSLDYSSATAMFTYSVSSAMSDASVIIRDLTGAETCCISNLHTDGISHQVTGSTRLASGFYLATLQARTANGNLQTRTIKIAVR